MDDKNSPSNSLSNSKNNRVFYVSEDVIRGIREIEILEAKENSAYNIHAKSFAFILKERCFLTKEEALTFLLQNIHKEIESLRERQQNLRLLEIQLIEDRKGFDIQHKNK